MIKMKPREAFFGLKDEEERPLDIDLILQNRNKVYDEVILAHDKSKKQNLEYHNKTREQAPDLAANQIVYKQVQGIKKKTKAKYVPVTVTENNGRTFIDDSGKETHKDNVKRV